MFVNRPTQQRALLSVIQQRRIVIPNNHGEKLVGILLETGSKELVIFCHEFQSSSSWESEGSFQYGNYRKEAEDLHAVVEHFRGKGHVPAGGNAVLLYAAKNKKGKCEYRVNEESLMDCLTTDTRAACLAIHEDCW